MLLKTCGIMIYKKSVFGLNPCTWHKATKPLGISLIRTVKVKGVTFVTQDKFLLTTKEFMLIGDFWKAWRMGVSARESTLWSGRGNFQCHPWFPGSGERQEAESSTNGWGVNQPCLCTEASIKPERTGLWGVVNTWRCRKSPVHLFHPTVPQWHPVINQQSRK